jgi:hypothetical protein
MATFDYAITVTDFTAGTVTLTSGNYSVREYEHRIGGEDEDTVSETIIVRAMGTANISTARTLDGLLYQAGQAQKDHNIKRVYLTFQEGTAAAQYRSEILQGRFEWEPEALTWPYWSGDTQFGQVSIERVNYWEGPEVQIPLTNANGTADTSGLRIGNCNDLSGTAPTVLTNVIDIAGTSVAGVIPGATRLEMQDDDGQTSHLWIGQNWTNPATMNHWLEAEDADEAGGTASAIDSGGEYVVRSLSSGAEATLFTWTLDSAAITAYAGGWYRALLRAQANTNLNTTLFRLKITWNGFTIWQSGQAYAQPTAATATRDLFTLQIPPLLQGVGNMDGMKLLLTGQQSTGSAYNLSIDALHLAPLDGWRYITSAFGGTEDDNIIVDDGFERILYHSAADKTLKVGNLYGAGHPIMLKPAVNQRLYFLSQGGLLGGGNGIARFFLVKLYHRPRRRGL